MRAGAGFGCCHPTIHGTRLLVPGHAHLATAHTQHKRIYGLCHVIASWIILSFSEECLAHLGSSLQACWRSGDSKHGRCHSAAAPAPLQHPPANLSRSNLGPPEPPHISIIPPLPHHCVPNPAASSAEATGRILQTLCAISVTLRAGLRAQYKNVTPSAPRSSRPTPAWVTHLAYAVNLRNARGAQAFRAALKGLRSSLLAQLALGNSVTPPLRLLRAGPRL